jgi:outer membrane receptor protein involved in Fe transport
MKHCLLLFSLLAFCFTAFAQNVEVKGTILDEESNEPLAGATVKYDKGKGAVADASGKFKLSLPEGEYELTISYTGYKNGKEKLTVKAGETPELKILMKPSAIQINQVVTVSQYKKNAAKETVTIEVVSKTQIKNTNSNDLGEAVSKTPGVLVQDGQISIRGGSSYSYGVGTRTAVLSDGLSMMSADLGEGQGKMVPLANVKQVEVIKGASSVVYGSSALNGVVNVVTEWPTDYEPQVNLDINFGVYGNPPKGTQKWWGDNTLPAFGNVNLNYQQRIKQLQVVAAGNITRNDGYLESSDETRAQALFKLRYLDPKIEGLNFGLNGSVQAELSNRFFISKDVDTFALYYGIGSGDNYIRTSIDPFVSYTGKKGHKFTGSYRYMNIFRNGNAPDPDAVSHQIIADNQYQYRWKNMLVFTAGFPFNVGLSRSNLYPELRKNFAASVYGQLEFNYKILTLQGGLRYEISAVDTDVVVGFPYRNSESKVKNGDNRLVVGIPIFRAGMNIQAAKATFFRFSWGQGYRIPSVAEKYIANEFVNGLRIIPNDTLKSERGWSLELGFKQGMRIGKWSAYFDAAFFWQEYKNFIEYQLATWPNYYGNGTKIFPDSLEFPFPGTGKLLGLKALNIENARIAGYEIGLAGAGKIGPVGLQLMAGYTYTWPGKAERDSAGNASYPVDKFLKDMFYYNFHKVGLGDADTSKLLYYRIRHLFRADIEVTYWKMYLGATLNYGSVPEKIPGLFNAAANLIFQDVNALNNYLTEHSKGDFFMDMRVGFKFDDHFTVGLIIKNVTNRMYSLRPGKAEPIRNFTVQLRYKF